MNQNPESPVLVTEETCRDGEGSILHVELNRPERLNAVDLELLTALGDALAGVAGGSHGTPPVRAVLLSGAGRTLSAGADLVNVIQGGQEPTAIMAAASRVILGIVDCPVPVVCALTGRSAGFGVSLGLVADITVMADDGALVLSFLAVGLSADGGVSQLLPAVVGRQVATKLLMTGDIVEADLALGYGLVAEVAPEGEVLDRAGQLAAQLASKPSAAVAGLKRALVAPVREELRAALSLEAEIQEPLLAGPALVEAARRFVGR